MEGPPSAEVNIYVCNERRRIGVDVIKHAAYTAVVEIARASAYARPASSKDIPRKTDTWHEVGIDVRLCHWD